MQAAVRNSFLEGNFAPVAEEVEAVELTVTGTIPEWLDGRYLRIGPNPIGRVDPGSYHWFTGAGMVHGVRLRDGRAEWYRNRWVRSGEVATALGEAPRPGSVHFTDLAANTNVVSQAGRTFALVEGGPRPYELTGELDTVGSCDFDGTLPGGYSAHPLRDPATGELHAVSYFWGWGNKVQYSVLDTSGRLRRTVDVEVTGSPMMHAFSLTEAHVLIYDLPVTFDMTAAVADVPRPLRAPARALTSRVVGRRRIPDGVVARIGGDSGGGFPYGWNADYPARIGVLPRDGDAGDVRWFDVEPCYVFHPLNGYDDGPDRIVVDITRHERTLDTARNGPKEPALPTLDRWVIDLTAGKVIETRLDDRAQEFPRIDERLVGRRHRYGYTIGHHDDHQPSDRLYKHDLDTGDTSIAELGPGRHLSEFVLVPSSPDAGEDEGVLLGYVYNQSTGTSTLTMLDAATLDTVAEVHLPARVPYGFHGNWLPT